MLSWLRPFRKTYTVDSTHFYTVAHGLGQTIELSQGMRLSHQNTVYNDLVGDPGRNQREIKVIWYLYFPF